MRRVFMMNVKPKSVCILQESECAFKKGTVSNYIFFILLLFSLIFLKLTPTPLKFGVHPFTIPIVSLCMHAYRARITCTKLELYNNECAQYVCVCLCMHLRARACLPIVHANPDVFKPISC